MEMRYGFTDYRDWPWNLVLKQSFRFRVFLPPSTGEGQDGGAPHGIQIGEHPFLSPPCQREGGKNSEVSREF